MCAAVQLSVLGRARVRLLYLRQTGRAYEKCTVSLTPASHRASNVCQKKKKKLKILPFFTSALQTRCSAERRNRKSVKQTETTFQMVYLKLGLLLYQILYAGLSTSSVPAVVFIQNCTKMTSGVGFFSPHFTSHCGDSQSMMMLFLSCYTKVVTKTKPTFSDYTSTPMVAPPGSE